MTGEGVIEANPNPIAVDFFTGVGATTLSWKSRGTEAVEVRVGAPHGDLFSRSGPDGSARTGDWVYNGMVFYLQDVTGGKPLCAENTLATVTAAVTVTGTDNPELVRLRLLPRNQSAMTDILGTTVELIDGDSFIHMYQRIFVQEIYRFSARDERPYVIDGGANIGLFAIYCKKLYPQCEIDAFEADVKICRTMQNNIGRSGYSDIRVICAALSSSEADMGFASDGALGGHIRRSHDSPDTVVRGVRLRNYLDRPVAMMKLSIEGSETEVLLDCADKLRNVSNIALRYHSVAGEPQTLHKLLTVLAETGFRLHIKQFSSSAHPLVQRELNNGEDLQLRIYAFRE